MKFLCKPGVCSDKNREEQWCNFVCWKLGDLCYLLISLSRKHLDNCSRGSFVTLQSVWWTWMAVLLYLYWWWMLTYSSRRSTEILRSVFWMEIILDGKPRYYYLEHLCIAKYSNAIVSLTSKLFRIQLSIAAEQQQTASEMGMEFRELREY